jgi:peptidoglycan hydrolase-like protein with peptidoglycan-binding domain
MSAQSNDLIAAPAVEEPSTERRTPPRRRGRVALLVVVVVACVAAGAWFVLGDARSSVDAATSDLPPNTTRVARRTLQDTQTSDGQLGYGRTRTATSRLAGTLTAAPDSGDQVGRGRPVYEIDKKPVSLLYGTVPAYRDLRVGAEGADVAQLEKNLRALGYSGFTVDDVYTDSTAAAVAEWQEDLQAAVGDPIRPGQPVLSYTATTKEVTVSLDAADQRLAKEGTTVSVALPDGSTTAGRISDTTTVIKPAEGQGQDPETSVEVVVTLPDQKAASAYVLASVDVTFTAAERKNVLTVPVAALLALREGGFGVEVVDGDTTRYVPVRTGLFSSGWVERRLTRYRPGRVGRHRRPIGIRQVDHAQPARHPGPADLRKGPPRRLRHRTTP